MSEHEVKNCKDCVHFESFGYGDMLCVKFEVWFFDNAEFLEKAKACKKYKER